MSMNRFSLPRRGFLLIELSIASIVLGILATTVMYLQSHISRRFLLMREEVRQLFFTRACLEERKVFRVSAINPNQQIHRER